MPLSEHEERILAEIERHLAADDPRFVARARRRRRSLPRHARLRLALALGVLGVLFVGLLGFLGGSLGFASAVFGMALVFVAILLGVTAAAERPDRARTHVPPDERH